MKAKKIILLALISVALITSCTKQDYWEIPKDENGNAIITQVSKTTSPGITMLDPSFVITSTLPNAKVGDIMTSELVKPQIPSWDPKGAPQILPIANTKKQAIVDNKKMITVSYTRQESTLTNVGDYVSVTLAGQTESGFIRINLKSAFAVSMPDATIFSVKVTPANATYSGDVVAKYKKGAKGTWSTLTGSPFNGVQPYVIPTTGSPKDTIYYSFKATLGSLTEEYTTSIVVK